MNFETLQILILLLPGIISSKVLDFFIARKKPEPFEKILESLVFSMIIYVLFTFFSDKSPVYLCAEKTGYFLKYNAIGFLGLFIISLFIPVIFGVCHTYDFPMNILRRFKLTNRTSRDTIWYNVFCDLKTHIIINFENGRRIYGWPMYYSDDPAKPYIFLHKPAWIDEGKFTYLDIKGILITSEQKIESVEFLNK